jgi:hypothetical protein
MSRRQVGSKWLLERYPILTRFPRPVSWGVCVPQADAGSLLDSYLKVVRKLLSSGSQSN